MLWSLLTGVTSWRQSDVLNTAKDLEILASNHSTSYKTSQTYCNELSGSKNTLLTVRCVDTISNLETKQNEMDETRH